MYGIYRATQWGFSLWELGVYEDSLTTDVYTPVTNLDDIKIYPIPFDNWFTVQSTESNPIRRVEVYNLNSALIESFDYNNGVTEINISLPGIQPGLYYVVIYSNSSVAVKKVLKF
ncbi:hypothetical protein ES705_17255 [subsurface metagenome]